MAFEEAGAIIVTAGSLPDAVRHVEQVGLSVAVLDFGIGNEDADGLCERMRRREMATVPSRRSILKRATSIMIDFDVAHGRTLRAFPTQITLGSVRC